MPLPPTVSVVQDRPRMARKMRRPTHTWNLQLTPYVIQPMLLAPVLPGETMKNALMQVRAVSNPVKNPLIGWWLEHFLFYVKLTDLDDRDTLQNMLLDPSTDISAIESTSQNAQYYFAGDGVNWSQKCLKRVVEEYFRNESEAWDAYTINNLPVASIMGNSWLDSVRLEDTHALEDVNVDLDADTTITASEVEKAMQQYELAKMHNLVDISWEDYLAMEGIRVSQDTAQHVPELLRFSKDWTYPANTINTSNGTPVSALSWVVSERADKDRFFKEPGFIFGCCVARPKVYLRNQIGSAAWYMNDAFKWLPSIVRSNQPGSTMFHYPYVDKDGGGAGTDNIGPLSVVQDADGYWVDIADLFEYGDQFVNYNGDTGTRNSIPLPTATLNKRYLDGEAAGGLDEIKALFDSSTAYTIDADGVIQFSIASRVMDTTPTVNHV